MGTVVLVAAVVGSCIMGIGSPAATPRSRLANTIAAGATLAALISTFAQISGAHFNPAVTVADACLSGILWRDAAFYIAAQLNGAIAGVLAHISCVANRFSNSHTMFVLARRSCSARSWLR